MSTTSLRSRLHFFTNSNFPWLYQFQCRFPFGGVSLSIWLLGFPGWRITLHSHTEAANVRLWWSHGQPFHWVVGVRQRGHAPSPVARTQHQRRLNRWGAATPVGGRRHADRCDSPVNGCRAAARRTSDAVPTPLITHSARPCLPAITHTHIQIHVSHQGENMSHFLVQTNAVLRNKQFHNYFCIFSYFFGPIFNF